LKTELTLFGVTLPLLEKIKIFPSGAIIDHRDIGVLRVVRNNKIGFGEVSPLPGLSEETFSEVSSLRNLKWPSLAFGLESAIWNMQDLQGFNVLLCGLLLDDEPPEKALDFEKSGYKSVKLKMGRDLNHDIQKLESILNLTEKIKFRLDFNGQGKMEDFEVLFKRIPLDRVEYIEDPVPKDLLPVFASKFEFPVAIDTDVNFTRDKFLAVIKPTHVGMDFPCHLATQGRKFIVSSSFESNLGLYNLGLAVKKWNLETVVHGLDTSRFFQQNILSLYVDQGALLLPPSSWVREEMEKIVGQLRPVTERVL
jgi:O-succinylbenzoate synthase